MSKKTLPFSYYVEEGIVAKEFTYDEWDQLAHRFYLKKSMQEFMLKMIAVIIYFLVLPVELFLLGY